MIKNSKNKKILIGAGIAGAVVVVTGLAFVFGSNYFSNQSQFLMRLNNTVKLKNAGVDFELDVDKYGFTYEDYSDLLDGTSGSVQTDGKNLAVELNYDDYKMDFIQHGNHVYTSVDSFLDIVNASQRFSYSSDYDDEGYDFSDVSKEYKGQFIDVIEFARELNSDETVDVLEDLLDSKTANKDTAQNRQLNKDVADFLMKLDQSNYSKRDGYFYLTLDKDNIKDLTEIYLKNAVKRDGLDKNTKENYENFLADFDDNYDDSVGSLKDLELEIGLGPKPGDSQIRLQGEGQGSSDVEVDLTLKTEQKTYKAPSKPDDILEDKDYDDLMTDITDAAFDSYDDSYDSYSYDSYDDSSDSDTDTDKKTNVSFDSRR